VAVEAPYPRETLALDEIDLGDPSFWAQAPEVRDGAFKTLRRERPLAHFDEWDMRDRSPFAPPPGAGFWAVTRHADVTTVSRSSAVFRSGQGAVTVLDLPPEMLDFFSGMVATDDPRHARLRRVVSSAFTPRRVREIEEDVQRFTAEIVSGVAPMGSCDFATDVATPLPLRVICSMMGVPRSEEEGVLRCTNVIMADADDEFLPPGEDPVLALVTAAGELSMLMDDIGGSRVRDPGDDLVTALVTANVDGESLSRRELSSLFICLLIAGSETTRSAIAHGLWALTEHQDQRDAWLSDLDGVTTTAVEEIVRWATPIVWMRRTLAEPAQLGEQRLEAGEKVLMYYASANRDETVFEDPYRFDVRRSPNPHVGFGAGGAHYCLGAHLARREIGVMWAELLRRLPDIRATSPPDLLRSSFLHAVKHLPCEWTPPAV
jgi:methyl-branched lipid omega-hydroxylase